MSADALMKHVWVVWTEKALESMRVDFLGYKCLSCDRRIRSPTQHVVLPTDLCMGKNDHRALDATGQQPMMTARERYMMDPLFHALVNALRHRLEFAEFTPTEIREAAMLAQIMYEEENPRLLPMAIPAKTEGRG